MLKKQLLSKSLKNVLSIVLFSLVLIACNKEYDQLLKSNDFGLKLKKAYEYYEKGDYYKAQVLLDQARPFYRGKPELESIYFHYAYTQFHQKKYIFAAHYFRDFAGVFPNSQYTEEALYMSAYANYMLSPSYRLEQTYSKKAIDGFQLFVNTYPTSERVERCNILIDELRLKMEKKAVAEADLYYRLREYQAATRTYKNVLRDYPDTKEADRIRFKIVDASYKLAANSIFTKQQERFLATIDEYKDFIERHPDSEYKKEANAIHKSVQRALKELNLP